jgi:hypothetical protein
MRSMTANGLDGTPAKHHKDLVDGVRSNMGAAANSNKADVRGSDYRAINNRFESAVNANRRSTMRSMTVNELSVTPATNHKDQVDGVRSNVRAFANSKRAGARGSGYRAIKNRFKSAVNAN